jgi:hypothetical protein
MNKNEIIKEYVLKDKDSFSLAVDIYFSVLEIGVFLKNSIYSILESQIKSEILNAITISYPGYSNNQYIEIFNGTVKIQIQFWNFFRTPILHISGANDGLTQEIRGIIQATTISSDGVIHLNINGYTFNKITQILDLYDLYSDENLKNELKESFSNHVLIPVKRIYDTIDSYQQVAGVPPNGV